jgi:hypothetical protein
MIGRLLGLMPRAGAGAPGTARAAASASLLNLDPYRRDQIQLKLGVFPS